MRAIRDRPKLDIGMAVACLAESLRPHVLETVKDDNGQTQLRVKVNWIPTRTFIHVILSKWDPEKAHLDSDESAVRSLERFFHTIKIAKPMDSSSKGPLDACHYRKLYDVFNWVNKKIPFLLEEIDNTKSEGSQVMSRSNAALKELSGRKGVYSEEVQVNRLRDCHSELRLFIEDHCDVHVHCGEAYGTEKESHKVEFNSMSTAAAQGSVKHAMQVLRNTYVKLDKIQERWRGAQEHISAAVFTLGCGDGAMADFLGDDHRNALRLNGNLAAHPSIDDDEKITKKERCLALKMLRGVQGYPGLLEFFQVKYGDTQEDIENVIDPQVCLIFACPLPLHRTHNLFYNMKVVGQYIVNSLSSVLESVISFKKPDIANGDTANGSTGIESADPHNDKDSAAHGSTPESKPEESSNDSRVTSVDSVHSRTGVDGVDNTGSSVSETKVHLSILVISQLTLDLGGRTIIGISTTNAT